MVETEKGKRSKKRREEEMYKTGKGLADPIKGGGERVRASQPFVLRISENPESKVLLLPLPLSTE